MTKRRFELLGQGGANLWLLAFVFTLVVSALAGCATDGVAPAPKVVTQEVKVAVPVSCVPKDVIAKLDGMKVPFSKEDLAKAPSSDVLLKELYADYRVMGAKLGILDPVVRACE